MSTPPINTPLWTSAEVAAATGGRAQGPDWRAGGVCIDSRSVVPGDLFVALAGPNHDGHDFVSQALADGAAAALVHRVPAGLPPDAPLVVAADTMAALEALGRAARARASARIVAVTGSVGKTSSKEMLKLALEAVGPTHASLGSLNNQWGVPLSLARMPADCRFAIFELGMNHAGELTPLTRMVRPHVAIITSVEAVHMEFFASTAAIAAAKAEILLGVEPGGVAVLPRDNRHFAELRDAAEAAGVSRVASFGSHIEADGRLLDWEVEPAATLVLALFGDDAVSYRVGVPGRQWAANSLAVLLAAGAAGAPLEATAPALAAMHAPKGRGQRLRLPWGEGEIAVIDESYNASPVSMRAAIAALAAARVGRDGRRIAVLGDMLELGEGGPALHAGLAAALDEWRIDLVFTAGRLMRHLHDALPEQNRGGHAADSEVAAGLVAKAVRAGDVIMVKGSAGSRMGRVVKVLDETTATVAPQPSRASAKPAANGC
jgi:UDP-N-acetylmuramoyl-tripeptide--D-alanyl-D-alanine ligase